MRLDRPRIGVITLSESRVFAFSMLIFVFLCLIGLICWGWIILGRPASLVELSAGLMGPSGKDLATWMILAMPLVLLPLLLKYLRLALAGEVITFDS
jgi:hypothetical protein